VSAGWLTAIIVTPLVLFDVCAAFLPSGGPSVTARWVRRPDGVVRGPLAGLARLGVGAYRAAFAGRGLTGCRFEPSCSAYALEAVHRFGGVGGGLLTVRRLLRCQPLCAGGFDPVPRRRGTRDQPGRANAAGRNDRAAPRFEGLRRRRQNEC
jgi:putative membrane protein insertion efficiency factor